MYSTVCDLSIDDLWSSFREELTSGIKRFIGMGRTWEKFSSLPAKKPQKFETATGKENF